jgi:diguanylate cyclase (GGDEF)-like protein
VRRRAARGAVDSEEVSRDIARATTAATLAVAEFLATGRPPSDDESRVWLDTSKAPLHDTITLSDLTKLYLYWRDATLDVARDAIERLGIGREVAELGIATIRAGSDGSIVRMTKAFDRERQRLQELVVKEREQLRHQALHDALTGLPNRVAFLDRLTHALELAKRNATGTAVLFIDVDNFKAVNDLGGHPAGDQLLQLVAQRLRDVVRASDTLGRFAGDEFLILHEGLADPPRQAAAFAQRIHEAFEVPFALNEHDQVITVSIGIALADASASPEDLLINADRAMYQAKRRGAGRSHNAEL